MQGKNNFPSMFPGRITLRVQEKVNSNNSSQSYLGSPLHVQEKQSRNYLGFASGSPLRVRKSPFHSFVLHNHEDHLRVQGKEIIPSR